MHKKIAAITVVLFSLSAGVLCAQELSAKEAMTYFAEGVKAQQEDDTFKAHVAYQKALLLDPGSKELKKFILNNYGVMYFNTGQRSRAESNFREALAIDPNYYPAQVNLGFMVDLKKDELASLKYWMGVFKINLDALKPKEFIVDKQEMQEKKGKKEAGKKK